MIQRRGNISSSIQPLAQETQVQPLLRRNAKLSPAVLDQKRLGLKDIKIQDNSNKIEENLK